MEEAGDLEHARTVFFALTINNGLTYLDLPNQNPHMWGRHLPTFICILFLVDPDKQRCWAPNLTVIRFKKETNK